MAIKKFLTFFSEVLFKKRLREEIIESINHHPNIKKVLTQVNLQQHQRLAVSQALTEIKTVLGLIF